MEVPGRDGGPDGGPLAVPGSVGASLEEPSALTDVAGDAPRCGWKLRTGIELGSATSGRGLFGGAEVGPVGSLGIGPVDPAERGGPGASRPLKLTAREGGPLRGGGAVGAAVVSASTPPFLLTHFLSSGS